MTTKRKPEDVVLNSDAFDKAIIADIKSGEEGGGMDLRRVAFTRAYIAEADLIPRPQTVEEWVEQIPWGKIESYGITVCFPGRTAGKEDPIFLNIPRPKPPRMTDDQIDELARDFALKRRGNYPECSAAIDAYLAERAKLEKERGE